MNIEEIERALKLHYSYMRVNNSGRYLKIMDNLASGYTGTLSEKVCKLLDDYYKKVNVSNLEEAFQRLREMEINNTKTINHEQTNI